MAFELALAPSSDVYKGAMKTLTLVIISTHSRTMLHKYTCASDTAY